MLKFSRKPKYWADLSEQQKLGFIVSYMKEYPNLSRNDVRKILDADIPETLIALFSRVKALEHEVVKHLTN